MHTFTSSLHFSELEDLIFDPLSESSLNSSDAESARSSYMSFASVLDTVIYQSADPDHSCSAWDGDRMLANPEPMKLGAQTVDVDVVVDMELEEDVAAYTSRILSACDGFPHAHSGPLEVYAF